GARARARRRRGRTAPPRRRVRAVLPRPRRPRLSTRPPVRREDDRCREAARRQPDRDAGRRRCPAAARRRASPQRRAPARARRALRARPAGVGAERGARRLRGDVHLAPLRGGRPRRRDARRGPCPRARARARRLPGARNGAGRDSRRARLRRFRSYPIVIVRWSLGELPAALAELGVERPLLVASERWTGLDVPRVAQWSEVPSDRIEVPLEADSLLAVGGGSAIDTAKFASSTTGLPVVSVPTTYSGAEWTAGF